MHWLTRLSIAQPAEIRQILLHPTERGYLFYLPRSSAALFFGLAISNDRTQKNYCAANSKHQDDDPDSGVVLKNVEIHMHRPPLR